MQNNSLALCPLQIGWLLTLPLCQQTWGPIKKPSANHQGSNQGSPSMGRTLHRLGLERTQGGREPRCTTRVENMVVPNKFFTWWRYWCPPGNQCPWHSALTSEGLFPTSGRSMHRNAPWPGMQGSWCTENSCLLNQRVWPSMEHLKCSLDRPSWH